MKKIVKSFVCMMAFLIATNAYAQKRPNIVVIMVDDLPYYDLSCMHRGLASYRTPNIDRIANEGMMVSDSQAVPQVVLLSLPGSIRFVLDLPLLVNPVPSKGYKKKIPHSLRCSSRLATKLR